jgi:hypothetical protein
MVRHDLSAAQHQLRKTRPLLEGGWLYDFRHRAMRAHGKRSG